ncbi:MAG: hypothetical protein PHX08_00920 [Lachnospiraceae bacterium]|nr:hypothetical protein [Lachnospiraceae bacterium]
MHVEGFEVSKLITGSIDQIFCFLEARMSEAYNMITPARLIQATLSPDYIALSIERTHYTTEIGKNQDHFKVVYLTEELRNTADNYHLPLDKKIAKLGKTHFKLVKNELPVRSNSSA